MAADPSAAGAPLAGDAAQPVVAIQGLRKRFGDTEVLRGIDLQVQPGEVVALIGRSGSGKSTLLRCINGLETPQAGELRVEGQRLEPDNPQAMRALRQRVGMIFQSFNLFLHLSVGRNVLLGPGLVQRGSTRSRLPRSRRGEKGAGDGGVRSGLPATGAGHLRPASRESSRPTKRSNAPAASRASSSTAALISGWSGYSWVSEFLRARQRAHCAASRTPYRSRRASTSINGKSLTGSASTSLAKALSTCSPSVS